MNIETTFAPLLDTLVKSAAVILIGTALIAALRRSSAANRHAVSVTIFAALLLLPFTKLVPARWSFPLEKSAPPAVNVRLPVIATAPAVSSQPSVQPGEIVARPAPRAPIVIPWKKLAFASWLAGAMLLLARRALIALRLRSIVRRSFPIEDERLAAKVRSLLDAGGVRAEVRESDLCPVPLASGIVRPVVLLPTEAADWSDSYVSSALRHELGHVRRRDCITRLLADVMCALYWVNPLVWFAARQMRLAQEQACDDLVLNSGALADEYAGQLVEVVRSLQSDSLTARHALAMAQPSTLETRVLAIVDAQRDRSARSLRGALAGITFLAVSLALCTAAQLQGANEGKAAPVRDAQGAAAQQVQIEAKFIEFSGKPEELPELLKNVALLGKPGVVALAPAKGADDALKALEKMKGVDVLSAPRVITRSEQEAKIEVGREMRYATDWDRDEKNGVWVPKSFDTKLVGVTFKVTAAVGSDNTIDMHMVPEVTEFEGFTPVGEANPRKPEDQRKQPVFNTRKIDTTVTVKDGQTVVLGGVSREDVQKVEDRNARTGEVQKREDRIKRQLIVFVTARIAKPGGIPVETPAGRLNVPRLGQTRNEVLVGFGEPRESVILASGIESMRFETESSRFIAEISPKSHRVIQFYFWRRTPYTAEQIASILSDNAEGHVWGPIQGSLEEGFFFNRSDKGIARGGPRQGEHMIAILSGSEVKPKDAKPAESGIVPKKAVPAASPGEAPEKPAGKTGAATDPKPLEIVSDKMTLDKKTGTLSASGNVRIETAQATITAAEVEVTLKKTGAAAAAEKIILSQVDFRDATLREAVEFLAAKSKALDATGVGVNIILKEMEKAGAVEITLKLTDIPLSEALRYVAALANCELVAEEFALVIRPLPAGKVPAPNADPEKGAPNPPAAPAPAAPKSAALKKAGTIIFPKIDLRDATLSETVDFLRAKAKDLDPKGDGVNIILKPGGADAKITLSLANIPLAEALRYVAALADFEIVAEDAAIVVQPAGKK